MGLWSQFWGYKEARSGVDPEPSWVSRNRNDRLSGISCMAIPESLTETGGYPPGGVGKVRDFSWGDVESPNGVDPSYSTHRESWVKAKFDASL